MESVNDASATSHRGQSPLSHERPSTGAHNDATIASLPCAAAIARSASEGTPVPCGLPAMCESKTTACRSSCRSVTVSAPDSATWALSWNGWRVSIVLNGPKSDCMLLGALGLPARAKQPCRLHRPTPNAPPDSVWMADCIASSFASIRSTSVHGPPCRPGPTLKAMSQ